MADGKAAQLRSLRVAVIKGNASKVTQHLKGLALKDEAVGAAPSLLGEALSRGNLSIATTLLNAGAKPADAEGATLLVAALKHDGASLVVPLITALGPDGCSSAGGVSDLVREWTPLMHAAKVGQVGPIEALLKAKADVDARMARHGGTALMVAVQHSQLPRLAHCSRPRPTSSCLTIRGGALCSGRRRWVAWRWCRCF